MPAIHVCIDARGLPWSGIGRYLGENLKRMVADPRFRWTLLADPGQVAAAGIPSAPTLTVRPWFRPIFSPFEQLDYPRLIPACDLYWAGHFNVPLAPVRARRRAVTLYDLQVLAQPEERTLAKRLYARLLFTRAAASAAVFTISDFSASEIERRLQVPRARIHRCYCGVDPCFTEGASEPPPGAPYVLYVGNVKPHKNLHGALEAFLRLPPAHAGLRFVIVGKREGFHTPDRRIERLIQGHEGRVHFTGRVPEAELKAWYRGAQALLMPSFYEGFGLPVLEGLAFGLPVVTARVASLPEVGGTLVHYCEPAQPGSIAQALARALEAPRPQGTTVREHLARFSWDRSAREHLTVLAALGAT